MKCIACGKESKHVLCPLCEISQLEYEAETALSRYTEAVNKLLYPESEEENANIGD